MLQCEINNFWLISTKSRSPQCRNTHSSQLIRGALKTYLRKPAETCCQSARQLIYCRGSYLFEGQCWSVLEWHHFLLWAVGSKKENMYQWYIIHEKLIKRTTQPHTADLIQIAAYQDRVTYQTVQNCWFTSSLENTLA